MYLVSVDPMDRSHVTKILRNLYIHFTRQDGQGKKKKKITQQMGPKYQKPTDENST